MRLNFPVINQRITTLSDGTRDPNAEFDCVCECDAGILEFYTGKHFEGGVLKELTYGRNYRGGTDEHAYVALMAHYGVKVYPIDGDPGELVITAHQHIKAGHPVLITEIDPYMPAGSGYTHVIVLFEEHAGGVIAMDPYIAQGVTFTDAELAMHMAVREVWIAEKIGDTIVSIFLTTPGVSNWFKAGSGNSWICLRTGVNLHDGMLNFYRTLGGSLAGLTLAGLPLNNEHKPKQPAGMADSDYQALLQAHPEITEQDFERFTLRYDPAHAMDKPPGASAVYVVNRNQIPTPVADTSAQQAELEAANSKVTDLEKQLEAEKAREQRAVGILLQKN